jgi:signal transduction histidine kinase/ligand-binding sensor domain-containing protein
MIPPKKSYVTAIRLNLFIWVSLGCILLFSSPSLAQLNSNNLTLYTEKDGLPGTQINKIIVDQFGYIWVGTINGLAKFDGYSFKRFYEDPNNPGSIKGLNVWSLFEDSKGRIWVGASPGKLNVYDPSTQLFREYPFVDLFEYDVNLEKGIAQITEDNNGRIYFGVHALYGQEISNALLYFDEQEDKIKRFESAEDIMIKNIVSMTSDQEGMIWVNSYSGFFKIDKENKLEEVKPKNISKKPALEKEYPTGIISEGEGYLWMITNLGRLFKLNVENAEYEIFSPVGILEENFFNSLTIDANGNLWMATNYGPFLYYPEQDSVVYFKEDLSDKFGFRGDAVNTLAVDQFGGVWAGTQVMGLLRYEERSIFKSYTFKNEESNSILSGWADNIVELPNGKLLVTTSGINIIDLQSNVIESLPYNKYFPSSPKVFSISEVSAGEYYLNSNFGVYQFTYPEKTVKKISIPGIPESNWVSGFFNDSKGNQWAFTNGGIYTRRSSTAPYSRLKLELSADDEKRLHSVVRVYESEKYGLWLPTDDRLFLYNYTTGQIGSIGHDKAQGDILGTQDINSFYEDKSGIAWIGAWQGGLNRFDVATGKIKTYTVNDGLPSMSIQSIIADKENENLWLSTFEGISRFHIPTEQFYNYSIDDGIQGQLYADGSYLKTSKGQFIFGGSNGITIFDPNTVNTTSIPPRVFLTEFKLFNERVLPGENSILKNPIYDTEEVVLAHNQNNITLEFIALHYSNPLKNKFAYKLDNYDNDWRESTNFQAAYYPNLSPGEYVFHVKAANNNGVWNEEGAKLKIIINKPWWLTIWAYLFYGLVFIIALFGADRIFRHRVVLREREKAREKELEQAKEIEKAYTELKATQAQLIQSEKMASLGELTAGIAHEIQNPLNFVNNFSEVSAELVDEIRDSRHKTQDSRPKTEEDEIEDEILEDIKKNLEKINHHGKRADAIVKGMLEHSRTGSGVKELTDINILAGEYLNLAYQSFKSKNEGLDIKLITDLDPSLPKMEIVRSDIGKVLLNILNNAFYAVGTGHVGTGRSLQPMVTVSTSPLDSLSRDIGRGSASPDKSGGVKISISDNGPGIPDAIKSKIFQPFFTTKPTGQGTGLGLSLSYDIVKAHGGEIRVETKEGEGSEFIIIIGF